MTRDPAGRLGAVAMELVQTVGEAPSADGEEILTTAVEVLERMVIAAKRLAPEGHQTAQIDAGAPARVADGLPVPD